MPSVSVIDIEVPPFFGLTLAGGRELVVVAGFARRFNGAPLPDGRGSDDFAVGGGQNCGGAETSQAYQPDGPLLSSRGSVVQRAISAWFGYSVLDFTSEVRSMAEEPGVQELRDLVAEFEPDRGHVMPALHKVQDRFGYIPKTAFEVIARQLNSTPALIYGAATFYTDY